MADEKDGFVLNNMNDKTVHTEKQKSMERRKPKALTTQPDRNPPVSPPIPSIIILSPRSFWASPVAIKLCIHVGIHEKMAHNPINIVPKIIEPITRSLR